MPPGISNLNNSPVTQLKATLETLCINIHSDSISREFNTSILYINVNNNVNYKGIYAFCLLRSWFNLTLRNVENSTNVNNSITKFTCIFLWLQAFRRAFSSVQRRKSEKKAHRESNNSSLSDKIWKKAKILTAGTNEYSRKHVRA